MNNKGFTLVEMLVSFVIVSIVAGIMMNVLFTIKERSEKSYTITQLTVTQANITKLINNDLKAYPLTSIVKLATNSYRFTYVTLGVKDLTLDPVNNKITYGSYVKVLPTGGVAGTPMTITNTYVSSVPSGNNSVLKIMIPITSIYNDNTYNIVVIYQFVNTATTLTL